MTLAALYCVFVVVEVSRSKSGEATSVCRLYHDHSDMRSFAVPPTCTGHSECVKFVKKLNIPLLVIVLILLHGLHWTVYSMKLLSLVL